MKVIKLVEQKPIEYEKVESTSIRTFFKCVKEGCGEESVWVPSDGCPKCRGTIWLTKYREVAF